MNKADLNGNRLLTADELREVLNIGDDSTKQPDWPTVSVCIVCWGDVSLYSSRFGTINNRMAAHQVRLLQHGWLMSRWNQQAYKVGNYKLLPHACDCPCDHAFRDVPRRDAEGQPLPPRMFEHATECTKCGLYREYSSED